MMQQQAALMAATQGSYLNPMAAIAAAQMQQMAAFNVNGLVAAPMTPSSGGRNFRALYHTSLLLVQSPHKVHSTIMFTITAVQRNAVWVMPWQGNIH